MQRTQRGGISATHAVVEVPSDDVVHRPYRAIRELLAAAALPTVVRDRALATFRALAEVEGAIHGAEPDDVEFHEVGSLDAIIDIVGSCAALASLGVDEVRCSPITVGTGTITAAHGILPNPGPAVIALLARVGAPASGIDVDVELTTPTGAALMTALAAGFGPLPKMTVRSVGYGAGTRDLLNRPNLVQVVVGESMPEPATLDGQPVRLLEANLDDVTGEVLGPHDRGPARRRRPRRLDHADHDEEGPARAHRARAVRSGARRCGRGGTDPPDGHARVARLDDRALAAAADR